MQVSRLVMGDLETNTYIVIGDDGKSGILIDPSSDSKQIIEVIESNDIDIKAMLVTHGHFDHISAIPELYEYLRVPVITHIEEAKLMKDPEKNISKYFYRNGIIAKATQYINENDILDFGKGLKFKIILIPGHSPKGVCYYIEKENIIFSGDTLLKKNIGRVDYYEGSPEDLCKNIKSKLFILQDKTVVYSGHGLETTIGYEKYNNPVCYVK